MTYSIINNELHLYVTSVKAAQWIARFLTTNVAEIIYFELVYGLKIISLMRKDGIKIRNK